MAEVPGPPVPAGYGKPDPRPLRWVGDGRFGYGVAVQATIPLTPAYANPFVNVAPTEVPFLIPAVAGTGRMETPPMPVGTLTNFRLPTLLAKLSVWYSWDPVSRALTLCHEDLVSPDATCLITVPAPGNSQACTHYAYHGYPPPCGDNPNWNYCTSVSPGLEALFHRSVRAANRAVIDAAIAEGVTVLLRTPPPVLPPELSAQLRVVYKNGLFDRPHRPGETLAADEAVYSVESVWGGEITLAASDTFANVIGSTGDPKIAGLSWIVLWCAQFGAAPQCTSQGYPSTTKCTTPSTASPLGGHVILGQTPQIVPAASNSVFIMPICSAHNQDYSDYMKPLQNRKGVWLNNYLH